MDVHVLTPPIAKLVVQVVDGRVILPLPPRPPPFRFRQHPADEREAEALLLEERGRGPDVQFDLDLEGLVDGSGEISI